MDQFVIKQKLPTTTEEAERRYIHHYSKSFNGPASELVRLREQTQVFIAALRKRAPRFYDEKLPTLINQACSKLLTYNTNTDNGAHDFHRTHAQFLEILEGLQRSQPKGDVNFQEESERISDRKKLFKRQAEIQSKLTKLKSSSLDMDDTSDEEGGETSWQRIYSEIARLEDEQKHLAIRIATMEGKDIEPIAEFELRVKPGSTLSRLTKEQLDHLERLILEFYKENKCDKTCMYDQHGAIMGSMIEKLGIDRTKFQKEEIEQMRKNALDAYRQYHSEKTQKYFAEKYEEILNDKELLPKEGIILEGPDDIPQEVMEVLDMNDRLGKRKIEEMEQIFAEKYRKGDPDGTVEDPTDDKDEEDNTRKLVESIRRENLYNRVKEEPRDDYDAGDDESDESLTLENNIAASVIDGKCYTEYDQEGNHQPGTSNHLREDQNDRAKENGDDDDDDDDDEIQCLGTVEPIDKVKTVEFE